MIRGKTWWFRTWIPVVLLSRMHAIRSCHGWCHSHSSISLSGERGGDHPTGNLERPGSTPAVGGGQQGDALCSLRFVPLPLATRGECLGCSPPVLRVSGEPPSPAKNRERSGGEGIGVTLVDPSAIRKLTGSRMEHVASASV
jgi:hypothetical protein